MFSFTSQMCREINMMQNVIGEKARTIRPDTDNFPITKIASFGKYLIFKFNCSNIVKMSNECAFSPKELQL